MRNSPAYSSARSLVREAKTCSRLQSGIFLDANENSFGSVLPKIENVKLDRYPDPLAESLRKKLAVYAKVRADQILVGNGSDEIIWLLLLAFVESNEEVLTVTPTFSMYRVFANLLGLKVREIPLEKDPRSESRACSRSGPRASFSLDSQKILAAISRKTKLIFLCSPNNPTGQTISLADVEKILHSKKIVVVDEAYIEFSPQKSVVPLLKKYSNLVILRTFSKAWGLAGLRVGYGLMDSQIVEILAKVRSPYSVDALSQRLAEKALNSQKKMEAGVQKILAEREKLAGKLRDLGLTVFSSDANFLLVRFPSKFSATRIYENLIKKYGIVARDFSAKKGLENCLRITVGNEKEDKKLLKGLQEVL
ncbi:MAG: histidinol-phosphate transaminase [Patescibacteria group bacterium]